MPSMIAFCCLQSERGHSGLQEMLLKALARYELYSLPAFTLYTQASKAAAAHILIRDMVPGRTACIALVPTTLRPKLNMIALQTPVSKVGPCELRLFQIVVQCLRQVSGSDSAVSMAVLVDLRESNDVMTLYSAITSMITPLLHRTTEVDNQ